MNKQYLSLSISRQLAADYPVGDPFGGHLYGQRSMPFVVLGVVGTGLAVASAVTAVGAVATVGVAIAAVSVVAAAAMVVGTVMTIVGMATGNESLKKIGGYVSMAGGVASLGAGIAGSLTAAETATSGVQASTKATGGTDALSLSHSPLPEAATVTPKAIPTPTPITTPIPAPSGINAFSDIKGTGAINSVSPATPATTTAIQSPTGIQAPQTQVVGAPKVDIVGAPKVGGVGDTVGDKVGSWWDKITPAQATMYAEGAKGVGGILQGAYQGKVAGATNDINQKQVDLNAQAQALSIQESQNKTNNGNAVGHLNMKTANWSYKTPQQQAQELALVTPEWQEPTQVVNK